MKNIIIYTHTPEFTFNDGGTVVEYLLAETLNKHGQNVRIYPHYGVEKPNPIFMNYYKNDFPIDDNAVVIYCEGTQGNPLNAKYVVRWMLSKLGQNVPYYYVNAWGKDELVYYFNSEEKIAKNPEKIGNIYKLLNVIYVNPLAINHNLPTRKGSCYTIRKEHQTHGKHMRPVHPPCSFEVTRSHTQEDYVTIFNQYKYFISYDSITFLSVIAALCGCVSIVVKVDGLSKEDWINTLAVGEYLKESGEPALYGIAYGADDLENAINTLHLVKEQWNKIVNYLENKYVLPFINDINNWDININTLNNNFY
jgi:hypothetical protein